MSTLSNSQNPLVYGIYYKNWCHQSFSKLRQIAGLDRYTTWSNVLFSYDFKRLNSALIEFYDKIIVHYVH